MATAPASRKRGLSFDQSRWTVDPLVVAGGDAEFEGGARGVLLNPMVVTESFYRLQ
ncbi:MAG: hypothetical protein H7Z41_06205 [Cytophagales bacterium]|nr:hypothetical protein [Armatimonadota bacterium]